MSLYLGLPQWSHPAWPGQLLGMNARPAEHLADYARVFNSVEGNTTFYASPTPETVQRWADAVPDHFRFSFKFPKGDQPPERSGERGQTGDGLHPPAGPLPCMTSWGCSSCNCPPASGQRGWPVWMPSSRGCPRISPMPSRCATPISSPRGGGTGPQPDADGAGHQSHHARQPPALLGARHHGRHDRCPGQETQVAGPSAGHGGPRWCA